jgi:hypothetical protein
VRTNISAVRIGKGVERSILPRGEPQSRIISRDDDLRESTNNDNYDTVPHRPFHCVVKVKAKKLHNFSFKRLDALRGQALESATPSTNMTGWSNCHGGQLLLSPSFSLPSGQAITPRRHWQAEASSRHEYGGGDRTSIQSETHGRLLQSKKDGETRSNCTPLSKCRK